MPPFWATFGKFGLLFIPTSGHTRGKQRELMSNLKIIFLTVLTIFFFNSFDQNSIAFDSLETLSEEKKKKSKSKKKYYINKFR